MLKSFFRNHFTPKKTKHKGALKSWSHRHFRHIQAKIKSQMVDISVIQSNPYFSINAAREVVLREALQEQLLREEVIWKQKSRKLWLTCIDLNTKGSGFSAVIKKNSTSAIKKRMAKIQ
jgi:hypothetical protein